MNGTSRETLLIPLVLPSNKNYINSVPMADYFQAAIDISIYSFLAI